jgi:hypothetical protein
VASRRAAAVLIGGKVRAAVPIASHVVIKVESRADEVALRDLGFANAPVLAGC